MKSGNWNDNPPLKILTNRRIEYYILQGRYGDERRQNLLVELERRRVKTMSALDQARALLKRLLQPKQ